MANIDKKTYSKKRYKVWSKDEMDSYGLNPYLSLISSIIYKERLDYSVSEVDSSSNELNVIKRYSTTHFDSRHTIRFFDGAHLLIRNLSGNAISMVFFFGKNLEENMNLVKVNRDSCIRFCGMEQQVRLKLDSDVSSGKLAYWDDRLFTERVNRLYRNALNELIENDVIRRTERSDCFWINPKVMMKGKTDKIPNSHNNFGFKSLVSLGDNEWGIGDGVIRLNDGVYRLSILDDVFEFATLSEAVNYYDDNK